MRKYKVTIFNPTTLYKSTHIYRFIFDAINHGWDLIDDNGDSVYSRPYYCNPKDVVERFANNIYLRDGEYVSIKSIH